MNSLDPRVNRLPKTGQPGIMKPKVPLDQFGTFEVFVQPKEGKPFQHEGIVHAPDLEMAYVLAKETFTRRFTCVSLFVAETRHVFVSPFTEGMEDVYNLFGDLDNADTGQSEFIICHLYKRGKQHVTVGSVMADTAENAIRKAKQELRDSKPVYNLWAIQISDIRFTEEGDEDFWHTLPEKKFRDAAEYKGGEKLKAFLEKSGYN